MKLINRWLTVQSLLMFWMTISQGQYICNDTYPWSNGQSYDCSVYAFGVPSNGWWWCPNGTYSPSTMWTGGAYYKYPEFNCCGCGKGWPLWFVPASGYTAEKAIPETGINMTNRLMCNDTYRNITPCTMKCKALPDNLSVTSLATMNTEDFNLSNCTLDLNTNNNSSQYIVQIPSDNYLIYFTNWTTDQYNFSCVNSTGMMTSNMLCRYEVDKQPFEVFQCPSNSITSRFIAPDCVDTENWRNTANFSCFEYEITQLWCAKGTLTPVDLTNFGLISNYPERNCCACGKGLLASAQSISISTKNNSINPSEIVIVDLKNCSTLANPNHIFDIKCLGPLNFINTNIPMNVTLSNCPLDCFFDWNTTQIKETQSINVSRQLNGSSLVYYLTSNLFSVNQIVCRSLFNEEQTTTDSSSIARTSEQVTTSQSTMTTYNPSTSEQVSTSQSTMTTYNPSTSEFLTTTEQPLVRQPFNCANGKIGFNCDISVDNCVMTKPCLNNGTCLTTNSSFVCLCPPWRFTGRFCEIDIRPCKSYTCLSHGTCIETNATSFICQCEPGYEGINCESLINYCDDVKCQNNGQCRPSQLNFTCECTTKDFSGRYCEIQSSSLATKQTVTRSFGYIALIALVIVAGIIILLDVLKYVFKIDPADKERKLLQAKKQQKHRPIAMRFIYVNKPNLDIISEEP